MCHLHCFHLIILFSFMSFQQFTSKVNMGTVSVYSVDLCLLKISLFTFLLFKNSNLTLSSLVIFNLQLLHTQTRIPLSTVFLCYCLINTSTSFLQHSSTNHKNSFLKCSSEFSLNLRKSNDSFKKFEQPIKLQQR